MTEFDVEQQSVLLRATNQPLPDYVSWDLSDTPDIAQTIAVCCFALGVRCHLSGLHTLKIKETDRIEALTVELSKLGAMVACDEYSISIEARKKPIKPNISIKTYNDHRMAMAFAPLVSRVPIYIEDHGVVSKSYPNFWKDMTALGLEYSLGN
jgi:3-phosphoshikimate 1-carboxyvinyltransferase